MPSASLQLNQLFSDPLMAKGVKGGALNFAGLLGNTLPGTAPSVAAFESLLATILKTGKASANASVLLGATPTTTVHSDGTPAKSSEISIEDLLKGLPPEIAALLRVQLTAQAEIADPTSSGILDALSVTPATDKTPELFAVIDDPELAAILSGLNAQIGVLKNNLATAVTPVQGGLQQTVVLSPALLEAAEKIKATIAGLQDKTITIASLDGDGFQQLKKIAFADIAPWLTQPRTVVIDGRHVAKIAQGPSFLNEDSGDITVMALNAAALVPFLPQAQIVQPMPVALEIAPALQQAQVPADVTKAPALAAGLVAPQIAKSTAATASTTRGDAFVATGEAAAATTTPQGAAATKNPLLVQAAAAGVSVPAAVATNSHSRGFGDIISEFLQASHDGLNLSADSDFSGLLKPQAETSTINTSASLLTARSAGAPHPSVHLVSVALQRNLNPHEAGTERTFSITMEPGQLGRVKITLQFGDNNAVKAKLIAERPETLSLLQKDVATLERVLSSNGFDTSAADAFSFDLGNSDSFSQAMHDNQQQSHESAADSGFGTDDAIEENVMSVFVDPATGLTHVNITV